MACRVIFCLKIFDVKMLFHGVLRDLAKALDIFPSYYLSPKLHQKFPKFAKLNVGSRPKQQLQCLRPWSLSQVDRSNCHVEDRQTNIHPVGCDESLNTWISMNN